MRKRQPLRMATSPCRTLGCWMQHSVARCAPDCRPALSLRSGPGKCRRAAVSGALLAPVVTACTVQRVAGRRILRAPHPWAATRPASIGPNHPGRIAYSGPLSRMRAAFRLVFALALLRIRSGLCTPKDSPSEHRRRLGPTSYGLGRGPSWAGPASESACTGGPWRTLALGRSRQRLRGIAG